MSFHPRKIHSIFLADDDMDDCLLFKDALNELPMSTASQRWGKAQLLIFIYRITEINQI
jgi:hypothetical protein